MKTSNAELVQKMREITRQIKFIEPDLSPAVRKERDRCCLDALRRLKEFGCVPDEENTG